MEAPKFLYGDYRTVRKAVRKRLKQLLKGMSWDDVIGNEYFDMKELDAFIILDASNTILLKNEIAFNLYLFPDEMLNNELFDKSENFQLKKIIIGNLLKYPWGVLALSMGHGFSWFFDLKDEKFEYAKEYILQCEKYWNLFVSLGNRYTLGIPEGDTFVNSAVVLYGLLIKLGIKKELFCGINTAEIMKNKRNWLHIMNEYMLKEKFEDPEFIKKINDLKIFPPQ